MTIRRQQRPVYVLILILLTALVGYFVLTVYQNKVEALPILGPVTTGPDGENSYHSIPEFRFTDQSGQAFGSDAVDGKIYVANFFFTSCPTICPVMSSNLQKLQQKIRGKEDLEILSFTVDPTRDTPERLREYATRFHADTNQWHFLTGDKKLLYSLARKGYFLSATDGDGGPHDFIHSENFVLIDRYGRIRGYYDGTKEITVGQVANDIQKLRKSNS